MFKKYQHICKLNNSAVDNILDGTIYVFDKLDGSNCSIWLENDELC